MRSRSNPTATSGNSRRGAVSGVVVAAGLAVATLGAMFVGFARFAATVAPAAAISETTPAALWLTRAGLTPGSLAAAGVSAQSTRAVALAAKEHINQRAASLAQLDRQARDAAKGLKELEQLVVTGRASEAERGRLARSRAESAAAQAALVEAVDAVFASATAGLTAGQRSTIAAIRANRGREVPVEFLTSERTEAEWVLLRDTLARKRAAEKRGEPVPTEVAQRLAQLIAAPNVTAATNRAALERDVAAAWSAELRAANP